MLRFRIPSVDPPGLDGHSLTTYKYLKILLQVRRILSFLIVKIGGTTRGKTASRNRTQYIWCGLDFERARHYGLRCRPTF